MFKVMRHRESMYLLPPKLQRRGLVFKCKLVTMERVGWVTLVYGSYLQVANLYGVVTFFDSCRLLWIMMMFQQNLLSFSSWSLVYGSY